MSSNMERVAAMPDASLYVNRDGRRADDCVDSHGGGNLIKIPRSGGHSQKAYQGKKKKREESHTGVVLKWVPQMPLEMEYTCTKC